MKMLGLIEKVRITGKGGKTLEAGALVDTGARMTSIDKKIAEELELGPVIKTYRVKSPSMKEVTKRPVVKVKIKIGGKVIEADANINDRSHMKYPVLIGRNIIYGNFVVDVSRSPRGITEFK